MQTKFLPLLLIGNFMLISNSQICYADSSNLIPNNQSGLYYQMGGGDDVPLPAFYDTAAIPLKVESEVGLGFNCGAFNPVTSIKNSLNEIKHSAINVERQVIKNATSAITELPLYELSRIDPNLYNLMTTAMTSAREDVAVSTKSCEVMQSQIANGENPYVRWGQISLGHHWRQAIGTAQLSGEGDINQARQAVAEDAGKSGIPWVDPNPVANAVTTRNAGGENQPPIQVIHDSALVGYAVIMRNKPTQPKMLLATVEPELSHVFANAQAAADWISNVVGDETITTYNGGQKNSKPGVGLYADIQFQTQQILPKLQALVTGATPLSIANLQAVSPHGMALSPEIIHDISKQPKVIQSIMINKIAQNIAAMNVINKARLAQRVLQAGSRIPAIYSNQEAKQTIQNAISSLQQDVQNILMFVKARQTLMSTMLTTIVQASHAIDEKNTAIAMPNLNAPIIEDGAILQ